MQKSQSFKDKQSLNIGQLRVADKVDVRIFFRTNGTNTIKMEFAVPMDKNNAMVRNPRSKVLIAAI